MSTTFDFSDDGTLTIVLSDVDTGNSSSIAYTYNFINDSSFEIDYKDLITRRIYSDLYDGPLDTFEIIGITDKEIILGSSKSIFMTNDSYSSRYIYLTRL